MLAGPATAALDEWDDYCLPDDVLNAMLDAAAPAMPAAPTVDPPTLPHTPQRSSPDAYSYAGQHGSPGW